MSVLAQYLEAEGIATTLISLIKENSEAAAPPRALWVPFELGRTLGAPNDPEFQTRVLLDALALLTEPGPGPVTRDFLEEAPESQPNPNWRPPVDLCEFLRAWESANLEDRPQILHDEIAALRAAHNHFQATFKKTITGLIPLDQNAAMDWLLGYEMGTKPESPVEGMSGLLLTRFCADDLKTYYLEAGASGSEYVSGKQLTDWLWDQTALGAQLRWLRRQALDHGDNRERTVLGRFIVNAARGRLDDLALEAAD